MTDSKPDSNNPPSTNPLPDKENTVDQILCDLHDLGFHGKDLAHLEKLADYILKKAAQEANKARQTFDNLADELVEKKYQLRIEHNHADMKWYAYYAQRGQRSLFESDLYSSGEDDWKTASDTPTEALNKLKALTEEKGKA